ncbi:MAG: hypothetical protein KDK91_33440 [Gammaproteobacteria bacterium]|nr:hypothetical protein [Gammaproteobacteria bacterium]
MNHRTMKHARRSLARLPHLMLTTLCAAALSNAAEAALDTACSVSVTATRDGAVVETYTTDFSVARNVPFFDDFSTATRQKEFRASVTRENDGVKVHIAYFSDLGTFHAASFEADMLVALKPRTTSGGNGFFLSSANTPVNGNHEVLYTLMCNRT